MIELDHAAIRRISRAHHVQRLSLFGSAATSAFDPASSDADFLVEFIPGSSSPFEDYIDLKLSLEAHLQRPVDLVTASSLKNPYLAASVRDSAVEIYAA